MALLWVEGFEGYTTGYPVDPISYLLCRYSQAYQNNDRLRVVTGRTGGYAMWGGFDEASYFITSPLTTNDTVTVGFAFKFDEQKVSTCRLLSLYDNAIEGTNLRYTNSGELAIYRGTTLLETTTTLGLAIDTWYYIEMKVTCHDSTGAYEVQVNGFVELQASSVDTKAGSNNYHNRILFRAGAPGYTFDDIYILDSTGSKNNDMLGNSKVTAIYPESDNSVQWDRSGGGTNYENVDEDPQVDGDTTYVEDDTVNNTDLYNYENLAEGAVIWGIQINTDCRETDADPFDLLVPVKLGATQDDGSLISVGVADYTTKMRIAENDPTGSNWTLTNINSTQFGVKVG